VKSLTHLRNGTHPFWITEQDAPSNPVIASALDGLSAIRSDGLPAQVSSESQAFGVTKAQALPGADKVPAWSAAEKKSGTKLVVDF